jgi:hypothetical protein
MRKALDQHIDGIPGNLKPFGESYERHRFSKHRIWSVIFSICSSIAVLRYSSSVNPSGVDIVSGRDDIEKDVVIEEDKALSGEKPLFMAWTTSMPARRRVYRLLSLTAFRYQQVIVFVLSSALFCSAFPIRTRSGF